MVDKILKIVKSNNINRLNLSSKIIYKTSNEIWDKVNLTKYLLNFKTRSDALDYLIIKGFRTIKNERKKEIKRIL